MTGKLIKFSPDGDPVKGLEPCQYCSEDRVIGDMPTETGFNFFTNSAGNLISGVWEATPFKEHTGPAGYGVDEFMYVISGSVTLTGDDGESVTVNAGEAFVISREWVGSWENTETMRKYYVILE